MEFYINFRRKNVVEMQILLFFSLISGTGARCTLVRLTVPSCRVSSVRAAAPKTTRSRSSWRLEATSDGTPRSTSVLSVSATQLCNLEINVKLCYKLRFKVLAMMMP